MTRSYTLGDIGLFLWHYPEGEQNSKRGVQSLLILEYL